MPLRRNTATATRSALLLSAVGAFTAAANLAFNVLVARRGGVRAYGETGLLLSIATVAGVLAGGLQYATARSAIASRNPGLVAARSLRGLLICLLPTAVVLPVAGEVASYLHLVGPVPVVLTWFVCAASLIGAVPIGLVIAAARFRLLASAYVLSAVVRVGGALVLPGAMEATTGSLLASLVPAVLMVVVLTVGLRLRGAGPAANGETPVVPESGGESLVAIACAAVLWLIWSAPLVLARRDLDGVAAGRLAAAQLLSSGVLILTAPILTAFYPVLVRSRSLAATLRGLSLTGAVVAASVTILPLAAPLVLPHLYGTRFAVDPMVLLILGLSAGAVALSTYALWAARATRVLHRVAVVAVFAALAGEPVIAALEPRTITGLAGLPLAALGVGVVVASVAAAGGRIFLARSAIEPALDAAESLSVAS